MQTNKKFNKKVKSLLNSYIKFNKNLKSRFRADNLLLYFDGKANKDFNKFINLSNRRYKALKFGQDLEKILSIQKDNYSALNNQFKKEIIYNSPLIKSEKKKLEKSVNTSQNKEISNLRGEIFSSSKPVKYKIIQKIKPLMNFKDIKNKNKNKSINFSTPHFNKKYKLDENNNNEKLADKIINDDYNNFRNGMNNYHKLLNDAKSLTNINFDNTVKIERYKFKDIEYNLQLKNINSLSFIGNNKKNDLSLRKNDENALDVRRLMRIKNNSDNENKKNIFKIGYKSKLNNLRTLYNSCPNINNNTENNEKQLIKTENKLNFNNKLDINKMNLNLNFKDTMLLIKNEAIKGSTLTESFFIKKHKYDKEFENLYSSQIKKKHKKIKKDLIKEKLTGISSYFDKSKQKYSGHFYINSIDRHNKKVDNSIKILDNYLRLFDTDINKWIEEEQIKKVKNKNTTSTGESEKIV